MGIEHSSGSQTLCYINADHEEECFRNEFEMHNIFEMGFDIVQREGMSHAVEEHLALQHHKDREEMHHLAEQLKHEQHHSHDREHEW